MQPARPLPAHLRGVAFSTRDADAAGVARHRLRATDLRRPFRGIRSTVLEQEPATARGSATIAELREHARQRVLDYAPRLTAGQFFSHTSAALLWGMPLPVREILDARIHVSVHLPAQSPRLVGVVGHRLGIEVAAQRIVVLGTGAAREAEMSVASPITTMCLLATTLSHYELVAVGDFLLFEPARGINIDELVARTSGWRARPGARNFRESVPRMRARVRSPRETELRLVLVDAGFPEPSINEWLYDERGRFLGEGDLVYREHRIVFEYEGDHHRTDREQFRRDIPRRESFENAGYRVFRVIDDDLGRGKPAFLRRVAQLFQSRAPALSPPTPRE
jgi:hypothetical protein